MSGKTNQDIREDDARNAAQLEGHKFIELHLINMKAIRGLPDVTLAGVKTLRPFSKGATADGIEEFTFQIEGGRVKFKLDRESRAYVGWMYDDNEKGLYGEKGYNRDFLATHLSRQIFKIKSKAIQEDVERRWKNIERFLAEAEEKKKLKKDAAEVKVDPQQSVKDIEDQIAFLNSKLEIVRKEAPKRPAKRRFVENVDDKETIPVPTEAETTA